MRIQNRNSGKARKGTAVIEFAMVSPVFIMLLFGLIEVGRMMAISHILLNASRTAARTAVVSTGTKTDVVNALKTDLASQTIRTSMINSVDVLYRLEGSSSWQSINYFADVPPRAVVRVSAVIDAQKASWLPASWFSGGRTIVAAVDMIKER